ncbi:MAG TPA: hypothetical protein VMM18_00880 [Gemmatimonadaceae bacterium]|nr:hypothetical protein [Gemmatimonadaceae bacterium]
MSTPGSAPNERGAGGEALTRFDRPASGVEPAPGGGGGGRRPPIIRWRGLIPFMLGVALLCIGWILFGERLVQETTEEATTDLLGARVELSGVRIDEARTTVNLRALRIADPLDPMRNLLETGAVTIALEAVPLLEKKLVIRQLSIGDLRFNTARSTPAPPAPQDGFAAQTLREIREWTSQFRRPLLSFTPIDTIRSVVLDPTQLSSVRNALALRGAADSVQQNVRDGLEGLRLRETLDTAQALVRRLEGADVRTLGLDGTRRAVEDVRRTIDEINRARQRVEALEQEARRGLTTLAGGVRDLDEARRADYAFARGLLDLPSFEGPDLGNALFGEVSLQRMQQAMYMAALAEQYMPPGLRPREDAGPKRVRAAGLSVRFPRERRYPSFLLRRGDVNLTIGEGSAANTYTLAIANVTSAPDVVGAPVRFLARQTEGATGTASLGLVGVLDHTGGRLRDSVRATAAGISIPGFALPGLPFRVEPGMGTTSLAFTRDGDRIDARWSMRADRVAWITDEALANPANQLEALLGRVLAGLTDLEIVATLTGTMEAPSFTVRSNLDRALSDRLKAVAGEELRRAESRVRAEVDRIVAERVEPVKAHVAQVQTEADQRVADAKQRLDDEKRRLEERLRALTGGVIRVPGSR